MTAQKSGDPHREQFFNMIELLFKMFLGGLLGYYIGNERGFTEGKCSVVSQWETTVTGDESGIDTTIKTIHHCPPPEKQ